MSAANDFLNRRPFMTIILSVISSLIVAFTVRSANISKAELDSKASRIEVKMIVEPIKEDIKELKEADKELEDKLKKEFVQQITWLRDDLKLKQNKR